MEDVNKAEELVCSTYFTTPIIQSSDYIKRKKKKKTLMFMGLVEVCTRLRLVGLLTFVLVSLKSECGTETGV